jgi:voltage-gated potassium channel
LHGKGKADHRLPIEVHARSIGRVPLRRRLWNVLEPEGPGTRASRVVTQVLLWLIVLNVAAFALDTVAVVRDRFGTWLAAFELLSVLVFSVEYLLRLWVAVEDPRYRRPIVGRVRWAMSPFALIDLGAVTPFWLPFLGVDLRFARTARFVRLLRIAKFGRYSRALRTLGLVFAQKRAELVAVGLVLFVLLVLASSAIWLCEHEAQPDKFPHVFAAMWWAIVTLTTVGYGDVYPVTAAGRVLGAGIAVLGIGMFALPAGILGAAFTEELTKQRERNAAQPRTPHGHALRAAGPVGSLALQPLEPAHDADAPLRALLTLELGGFRAHHEIRVERGSLDAWRRSLSHIREHGSGSAELRALDDGVVLLVERAADAPLSWNGSGRDRPGSATELRFSFESPATDLAGLVDALDEWLPAIGG